MQAVGKRLIARAERLHADYLTLQELRKGDIEAPPEEMNAAARALCTASLRGFSANGNFQTGINGD